MQVFGHTHCLVRLDQGRAAAREKDPLHRGARILRRAPHPRLPGRRGAADAAACHIKRQPARPLVQHVVPDAAVARDSSLADA